MQDAMNQPIVIGQMYGYTAVKGSFMTVVIGRARKLTEKKVTLDVTSRSMFIYGAPADGEPSGQKHVSIHSCHLFPVPDSQKPQATRVALGFDIQRNVMSKLQGLNANLGFELFEAIREAALDACAQHGLVPIEK